MRNRRSATAVVIGGGVIGLSTAYHLAKKGVKNIILLEKGNIGDGASSRAGGIITGLLWTKTGVEARKISLALYRELSMDLADYGYQFCDVGCLNLFDSPSWQEREMLLPLYDESNVPYEVLDVNEIQYRWSELTPTPNTIGLFDPLGGYSEPHQYIPALAQRCRDLGVDIREQQLVTNFLVKGDNVYGVRTFDEEIESDVVICAVHTWTLQLLAQQKQKLPMKAFVHQRYITTAFDAPVNIPAINANPHGGYLRPSEGNCILVGGETLHREEYIVSALEFSMSELTAPLGYSDTLRQKIVPLFPRLNSTKWASEKVGLLSFSMDGEPILGHLPHLSGILVGAAFHSGGFAYNPVAGLLLAELALGHETSIDSKAFSPTRFTNKDTEIYLATRVTQEHAVQRRH